MRVEGKGFPLLLSNGGKVSSPTGRKVATASDMTTLHAKRRHHMSYVNNTREKLTLQETRWRCRGKLIKEISRHPR